jgi:serine/threonine protein kinase
VKGDRKYVLKTVKSKSPTPEDLAGLRHEYAVLKDLHIDGVVQAVQLESFGSGLALVMADFENGRTLRQVTTCLTPTLPVEIGGLTMGGDLTRLFARQIVNERRMQVAELLSVAIELVRVLGELHKQGIVHKDIKPDNIQYNECSGRVQLIDFGISTRPSIGSCGKQRTLEGTLAYMSPEQTGRLNRLVDYRTGSPSRRAPPPLFFWFCLETVFRL